jgi:hypothetical protein
VLLICRLIAIQVREQAGLQGLSVVVTLVARGHELRSTFVVGSQRRRGQHPEGFLLRCDEPESGFEGPQWLAPVVPAIIPTWCVSICEL